MNVPSFKVVNSDLYVICNNTPLYCKLKNAMVKSITTNIEADRHVSATIEIYMEDVSTVRLNEIPDERSNKSIMDLLNCILEKQNEENK